MAIKKAQSTKRPKVKTGKLRVKTTKINAKDLKKVKGGATQSLGYDWSKQVKI
ncbi:MAG TPA: hypothetical protein VJU86_05850 [Pyrinomonadaceae bacterium]|nr:hypothetical protein [Pyrinomonadaceae bacterium]